MTLKTSLNNSRLVRKSNNIQIIWWEGNRGRSVKWSPEAGVYQTLSLLVIHERTSSLRLETMRTVLPLLLRGKRIAREDDCAAAAAAWAAVSFCRAVTDCETDPAPENWPFPLPARPLPDWPWLAAALLAAAENASRDAIAGLMAVPFAVFGNAAPLCQSKVTTSTNTTTTPYEHKSRARWCHLCGKRHEAGSGSCSGRRKLQTGLLGKCHKLCGELSHSACVVVRRRSYPSGWHSSRSLLVWMQHGRTTCRASKLRNCSRNGGIRAESVATLAMPTTMGHVVRHPGWWQPTKTHQFLFC